MIRPVRTVPVPLTTEAPTRLQFRPDQCWSNNLPGLATPPDRSDDFSERTKYISILFSLFEKNLPLAPSAKTWLGLTIVSDKATRCFYKSFDSAPLEHSVFLSTPIEIYRVDSR